MTRKRWTPQTEITDALLRLREKRKWQLAYRRYVVEQKPSETYGTFFGLDIQTLREWFSLQFSDQISWDNYGKAWQFEHIIPSTYFNFTDENDLKRCWSFINMRVQPLDEDGQPSASLNLLAARAYFQQLLDRSGLTICATMLEKIKEIETEVMEVSESQYTFLAEYKETIEQLQTLDTIEMDKLNRGATLKDLLLEREILKKFS
jgi:hypothetical protein